MSKRNDEVYCLLALSLCSPAMTINNRLSLWPGEIAKLFAFLLCRFVAE